MEFQVSAAELSLAMRRALTVTNAKSTMPILSHVLMRATKDVEGGKLIVEANNMELGIVSTHAAEVVKEGSICLPSKEVAAIAAKSPESVILILLRPAPPRLV